MANTGNFIQVTPFIFVDSLEEGLAFFRDILGFEVTFRQENYAFLRRDGVGIRLSGGGTAPPPGSARIGYYIDVRDVDGLYAELEPKLQTLARERIDGPSDRPWGQRELAVTAPDGSLIVFGQPIERGARVSRPMTVSKRDLRGSQFTDVSFAESAFANVDLTGATFKNVRVASGAFSNADLKEARFTNVDLSAAEVSRARLAGMRIEGILVTDLIAAYRAERGA